MSEKSERKMDPDLQRCQKIRQLYADCTVVIITVPKVAPNSKEAEGLRDYHDHLLITNFPVSSWKCALCLPRATSS